MSKVYLVVSGTGMSEDFRVHAVFSTRDLARAYAESSSEERDGSGWDDLGIDEWDVDPSFDPREEIGGGPLPGAC